MNSSLCVLWGNHISRGKFDAFFYFVCVLGDFLGDLGFGGRGVADSWNLHLAKLVWPDNGIRKN